MRERPIIFSAPMVRAILEGRKTQTRRALRVQPFARPEANDETGLFDVYAGDVLSGSIRCPYGQPGDRIWVRESWQSHIGTFGESILYAYRATDDDRLGPWRPSIHMPRAASRILLEITDVRVQRLQETSEKDAIAEGIQPFGDGGYHVEDGRFYMGNALASFEALWDHINADRGFGWDANPWVWAITFRRIKA